jgi:hypothetical protein
VEVARFSAVHPFFLRYRKLGRVIGPAAQDLDLLLPREARSAMTSSGRRNDEPGSRRNRSRSHAASARFDMAVSVVTSMGTPESPPLVDLALRQFQPSIGTLIAHRIADLLNQWLRTSRSMTASL